MEQILAKVKRILGIEIEDLSKELVLIDFIEMYTEAINLKVSVTEFPTSLNFILVEAVSSRYRKIGSEGMKSEGIDVVSVTYHDEILDQYTPYFTEFKKNNSGNSTLPRIQLL